MGSHPLNLILRFLLELIVIFAVGVWGWKQSEGWTRFAFAIGIPLIMMIIWGTFAVPGDPSRSGNAPVVTPGLIRLLLELVFFGIGTWALYQIGYSRIGLFFGLTFILHYLASYDRVKWLLEH
jgi:hypothetical protein